PSLKTTTRCHSVFSLRSPVALSRQVSDVAIRRLAIGRPSWVRLISGSAPRLPIKITLFTLPAITALHSRKLLNLSQALVTTCAGRPWEAFAAGPRRWRLGLSLHLGTASNRPYTLAGPPVGRSRGLTGFIHI